MGLTEKPGRRDVMKWGLASAALPLFAAQKGTVAIAAGGAAGQVSAAAQGGESAPLDIPGRGGQMAALRSGMKMHYREDWLGAPWEDGEPVVFLHGNLETGVVWYGWVPRMALRFRLYRPDLPGFGGTSLPPAFKWTLPNFSKIVADFLDAIGAESAHIVGAKTGGTVALHFASTYPERVKTLVVASGPFGPVDPKTENTTMQVRLGSEATKEETAYFEMMRSTTSEQTRKGIASMISAIDVDAMLPRITAPTLIITSDRSALQSVSTVLRYQPKIPNSRLLVLASDAYHIAVAKPDECVSAALDLMTQAKAKA